MELDAFLANLRAEGELVDSGQFEMDPVVALQKLEGFQYAEPTTYFYPLLAACVGLGAASLAVAADKKKISLHYNGPEISQEILERLFAYAFSKLQPGLRHLALGVLGACRTPKTRVEIVAGDVRATFVEHKFKALPMESVRDGLRVEVHRKGWAARLLGLGPALEHPSIAQMQLLLRYCPCPVSWNGLMLSGSQWPQAVWSRTLLHRRGLYEVPQSTDTRTSPGEFSALLALDVEEAALHWVIDGMNFAEDPSQLGFPHARVVLVGPWKLDISYRRLVRDEAREAALETVRRELESMVLDRKFRMRLEPSHLNIQAHLVTRLTLRDDQASIEKLYAHLISDLESAYLEELEVPGHSLLVGACRYFRDHSSADQNFEAWFRASTLLTRAPLAELYCTSWESAKQLGHDVYGTMPSDYRRFLVRCWVWWPGAGPPEDANWCQEVLAVLPREGDESWLERETTDKELARCLERLHILEPQAILDFAHAGRTFVPLKYIHIHAHFDRGIREAENRLAAERYKGARPNS
ncbi:MAG: hypothetical protein KF760_15005 [Candidatus Eremiobacteraeota bacterium]|nr:hypothetical protein [Candidatus Eremiobacteraeota bacterium]MCW5866348.1 hypothetical protein [Candidatus Eremiobacteraeota bacterium]